MIFQRFGLVGGYYYYIFLSDHMISKAICSPSRPRFLFPKQALLFSLFYFFFNYKTQKIQDFDFSSLKVLATAQYETWFAHGFTTCLARRLPLFFFFSHTINACINFDKYIIIKQLLALMVMDCR